MVGVHSHITEVSTSPTTSQSAQQSNTNDKQPATHFEMTGKWVKLKERPPRRQEHRNLVTSGIRMLPNVELASWMVAEYSVLVFQKAQRQYKVLNIPLITTTNSQQRFKLIWHVLKMDWIDSAAFQTSRANEFW